MSHEKDLADQDLEEIAEELWTLREEGRDRLEDLRETTRVEALDRSLERLAERGLGGVEEGRVFLTSRGRSMAEAQVRRHRLAEMLLATVLDVRDDGAVNRTACVMEHALGAGVADSVCAFLGHPAFCPHGKPIPPGPCCRTFSNAIEPLVHPLRQLGVGQTGRIVYIVPRESSRLARLSALGIVPGAAIRLRQHTPAVVLSVGETTLALEPSIASEIYVKKII